ncbi:MAG: hypothetical protein MUF38_14680 [Anaerolineae bacterium]|nr:hypothetical protein [Anaerolineae bacterium]
MKRLFFAVAVLLALLTVPASAQDDRYSLIVPGNGQLVTEIAVFNAPDALNDAAFSPDSAYLAAVSDDTALRVWELASGELVAEQYEHFSFVKAVVWLSDALVTGSWDRTALVWDVADGIPTVRATILTSEAVVDTVSAPDGATAASFLGVGDGTVQLYDAITGEIKFTWEIPALRVTAIAISPDLRSMVTAGGFPASGAQRWNIATLEGTPTPIEIPYPGTVLAADYVSSSLIALGGDGATVELWDTSADTPIATLAQTDWVVGLDVSPAGDMLVVARQDGVLTLWDITDPAQAELIVAIVASEDFALTSVGFSPDGRYIVSTDTGGAARLWGVPVE